MPGRSALLAVVALALLGGCSGGGDDDDDPTPQRGARQEQGATATTIADSCRFLREVHDAGKTAKQLSEKDLERVAANAPREVKDDVEIVVDKLYRPYFAELRRVNGDVSKMNPGLLESAYRDPDTVQALLRVSQFIQRDC